MSLTTYVPGYAADLLVAQLWACMDRDGDLDRVFSMPRFELGGFFAAIRPPRTMLYAADAAGIWLAVWFEPFMVGTFLAAYIRPDRRATLAAASLFMRALRHAVATYGTVLNLTWQDELVAVHDALGYTLVGRIPRLFHGRDALVFACSADSLERRRQWHSLQHSEQQAGAPGRQPGRPGPGQAPQERPALPAQPGPGPLAPGLPGLVPLVLRALRAPA